MGSMTESVEVAVPVRTVYDQWTQFEDFPQFMAGVEEIQQVSDDMTHWRVKVGGKTREFDARITEQIPDERIAWTSTNGPRQAGVVTFHRLDAGHTRVTAQIDVEPEGLAENIGEKTGVMSHRVKDDLRRFRDYIESRGNATGSWRGEVHRPEP
jgi:uncharacterized membrane protein